MTEELSVRREKANLTQEELAQKLGVGQSAVSMWETGKSTPRPDVLKKLAALFGCTIDELLA